MVNDIAQNTLYVMEWERVEKITKKKEEYVIDEFLDFT